MSKPEIKSVSSEPIQNNSNEDKMNAQTEDTPWPEINVEDYIANLKYPHITDDYCRKQVTDVQFHRFFGTNTTVCCLTLKNGFTLIGKSACVFSENFNEKIGMKLAYEDAMEQIGQFEGYILATAHAMQSDSSMTDNKKD